MKPWFAVIVLFCIAQSTAGAGPGRFVTPNTLASVQEIGGETEGTFTLSPDRKWIVFQLHTPNIERGDYRLTWMTMPVSGAEKPLAVADGGEVILRPGNKFAISNGDRRAVSAQWAPDSKHFAYSVMRDGETQIWISRPGQFGQRQLTHGGRNVSEFAWSSDGSKIYYTLGLSAEATESVFAKEERTGFLFDGRFDFAVISDHFPQYGKYCSPDRKEGIVPFHREYDCSQMVWVHEIASGENRLATDEEELAYRSIDVEELPSYIKGERKVQTVNRWEETDQYAWVENKDPDIYLSGMAPLVIHAHIGGEVYRCAFAACSRQPYIHHQETWWDEDGQELNFTRRDGWNFSEMGVYAWAPQTGKIRSIYRSDNGWLHSCDLVQSDLICLYETLTTPPKLISMSIHDGSFKTLFDPNPEFSVRSFTQIEKLEWEDKFGSPTHGFLVYPKDYDPQKKYPLVFVTYSAKRFLKGGTGDEYPVHSLAAEGFFVLAHDRPLDPEILEKSASLNEDLNKDLYWRWATLSSQEIIIDQLVSRGLIDPHRVAITGLSEGAAQVFFAMMHTDKFATFISSGGAYTSSFYYLANLHTRERLSSRLNGSPEDEGSYWEDDSIENNLSRINGPLLLNVSALEASMAAVNANYLLEADKPVEMYVFPDASHIKWRPDHRLAIYRRNIQWLKFWLQDQEVKDPVSPGQYERWHVMRSDHCSRMENDGLRLPSYCQAVEAK